MAGLLGDSWGDPKTQAVMSMAAGLLGGGNFGQALGRGLGGYQSVMQSAKEAERQAKADALVQEQLSWKRDDRAQAQAQQQRRQQALGQLQQAMGSGQVTGQELLKLGIPMDLAKEAMTVKDMGRAEIARTIETEGPNGSKLVQGFDKFGAPVGQGTAGYVAPVQVNLGDRVGFMKPAAGVALPMGMSPEAKASNAVALGNLAVSRERLNFDKQGGGAKPQFNAEVGGFIYPPSPGNPQGGIVPLPGFQKPLNDVQSKAQLFGTRMQEADKVLADLAGAGRNFSTIGANAPFIGGLVSSLDSEKGQMLDQAKRDFTNAVLRRESGAAIGADEFDNANKQYFPQIGDSPGVIAQKARNRQLAVNGILAEVPSGAKPINVQPADDGKTSKSAMSSLPAANASNKNRVILDQQTGQRLRSNGMQWVPE